MITSKFVKTKPKLVFFPLLASMTSRNKQVDHRSHKISSKHNQTLSPKIMKLREDWKTRCKELKVLKQSIHDHNPISIPASYKPMVESNHLINYKKLIYISGSSLIEGISSMESKTET